MLLLLVHAWTGSVGRATAVAALFAWHPAHVESVAWVSERKDVLCALLLWLTLGAYTACARRPPASRGALRYAVVVLLFALALMAKPMAVTAPFLMLLLDVWPLGRLPLEVAPDVARVRAARRREAAPAGPGRPVERRHAWSRSARTPSRAWARSPCRSGWATPRSRSSPISRCWCLAGRPGRLLPAPGRPAAARPRRLRPAPGRPDLGCVARAPALPLPARRLAVVRGKPHPGDRPGAGGRAGPGRPVHLRAVRRARPRLSRRARGSS